MNNISKRLIKLFTLVLIAAIAVPMVPIAIATVSETNIEDNLAPVAQNLSYATYRGVAITGTLQAIDPEGDMIEYKLMTESKKGKAELSEDGEFTYTPKEGGKGKDLFTYVAVDDVGNVSEEATVKIDIQKQSSNVTYSDMDDEGGHYAALRLAEEGIFVGEMIGERYFFSPDTAVTRGEFLAMCMNMTGEEILEDITRTGFTDDEEISAWLKPYVTTALMSGTIKGMRSNEGELVFAANEPVTTMQAAVILNKVLELADMPDEGKIMNLSAPTWAYQATVNLRACDIINAEMGDVYESAMTRADVAQMICNTIDVMEEDSVSTLLSWVW